jgi:hypothetical protein
MPVLEGAARKKIIFCISKISFHFSLPIGIANGMGDEFDIKECAKTFYLRGDLGLGARAVSHEDAGVVDDTSWASAFHEPKGSIQKDPGLEPGEARVILDKELFGVTEDQSRTLGLNLPFTQEHWMGRGIVLHLLARTKFIGP